MKVVIAGGGTAGHVNPGIALAHALEGQRSARRSREQDQRSARRSREQDQRSARRSREQDDVIFIGTSRGAEARLVPAAGFALETIRVEGLDRGAPWRAPLVGVRALRACLEARKRLAALSPDVVVGMGGYVSLPVCLAARSLRIPLVVHEQNVVFGLANRVCKRLARKVAVSFEESLPRAGRRGVFVGNPVLPEMANCNRDVERERAVDRFGLAADTPTLLVFGGSQGARRINEAALGLRDLWKERTDRQVVHIVGSARAADHAGVSSDEVYKPVGFVERMTEAYSVADLAVCRGGATTVAELTVFGVPAIVVPYPYHRDRQQERHGRILERAGAAVVVGDSDADAARIASIADELLDDPTRLQAMRKASLASGRPEAAHLLAEIVREEGSKRGEEG